MIKRLIRDSVSAANREDGNLDICVSLLNTLPVPQGLTHQTGVCAHFGASPEPDHGTLGPHNDRAYY